MEVFEEKQAVCLAFSFTHDDAGLSLWYSINTRDTYHAKHNDAKTRFATFLFCEETSVSQKHAF